MKILLIDFYVDEPACFGVPPYLSPYIRYVAGALAVAGLSTDDIEYLTVDAWRAQNYEFSEDYQAVFVIMGTTVPGKYLGGKIGTVAELYRLLEYLKKVNRSCLTVIGGPVRYASRKIKEEIASRNGILIRGDIEKYAELFVPLGAKKARLAWEEQNLNLKRTYTDVDRYSLAGAFITSRHPNYPYLILEIETYRGCTRDVYCSFCTEAFYGRPSFRSLDGIHAEIAELYQLGNLYYRFGRQADLLTYLPFMDDFQNSFPRPNPKNVEKLYIGTRKVAPNIKLLHLDNINPGLIATFPREAEEIIRLITEYNTAGDTAAMGIESVDPEVIAKNDLKCSLEEARLAIEIVNRHGQKRSDGIPHLLPGLNFIGGLPGETKDTFKKNYEFLHSLLQEGLLLRRINIRQVVLYEKTKASRLANSHKSKTLENRFFYYRDKIRKEVDEPMLKLTFPTGSILKNVILEQKNNGYYLGRPLGSYPITVKIPFIGKEYKLFKEPIDIIITGHSERSLKGLPNPIPINLLTDLGFREIPGFGKNLASITMLGGPYTNEEEFSKKCPEGFGTLNKFTQELVY